MTKYARYITICGNVLFILWVTFNAIDESFKGTIYQKLSFVGLVTLLLLNTVLILRKK